MITSELGQTDESLTSKLGADVSLKNLEYIEVHNHIRHLYDFRTKILSFSIALNAALMSVIFQSGLRNSVKIIIAILAFAATLVFLLVERRLVYGMGKYIEFGKLSEGNQESHLLTFVWEAFGRDGIPTRTYIQLLYGLMLVLWIAQVILIVME